MARTEPMVTRYFAATDPDCDGLTTTVYRLLVPAAWHADLVKRKFVQWVGTGYYGESDWFPLTEEDFSLDQINVKWYDHSDATGDDDCALYHKQLKGKPHGWN